MLNKLFKRLMISCEKATFLMEKKKLIRLSWMERIQLRLHKSMCTACRMYGKQSRVLDHLLKKYFQDTESSSSDQQEISSLQKRILSGTDKPDSQ